MNKGYDILYTWYEKTQRRTGNIIESIAKPLNIKSGIMLGQKNGEGRILRGIRLFTSVMSEKTKIKCERGTIDSRVNTQRDSESNSSRDLVVNVFAVARRIQASSL